MMKRLVFFVMMLVALFYITPLGLMLVTSVKTEAEVLNPSTIIPPKPTFENYRNVLEWSEEAPFARWLFNSVIISTLTTLLVVSFSTMAAYAIARLKVRGGSLFLSLVIFSMMIPGQLFLVPVYFILSKLHWLDTPAALIIPATAGGFGVFMLTQFMRNLPTATEEAALIDGCSTFTSFLRITVPLCKPAMATLAVLTFIGSWNDYVSPLVYLDSVQNYTLPVGIAMYQASYYTEYGRTLATSVLGSLPLFLIFLLFQRHIVDSMASSGLKD